MNSAWFPAPTLTRFWGGTVAGGPGSPLAPSGLPANGAQAGKIFLKNVFP